MTDPGPMSPEYQRLVEDLKRDFHARGCGCGKWALPKGVEDYLDEGVVHRPNRPCYRVNESKQVGISPTKNGGTNGCR